MTVCAACGHEIPEGAKFCPECGAPVGAAAAPREQRKTVTVLFCDIAGSTALGESTDPEALRALLARYFERMKEIVERHGGSVEKFIGDAVMAVFGVPVVHEDDALRACRAAVEMRDALPELGIRGRIGLNTGEVVTGTEERLATGDAVNVAARLEQAAEPGEVLVGAQTVRLVRDAVELGEERRLELKGKSEPVAGLPLLAAAGEVYSPLRRSDRRPRARAAGARRRVGARPLRARVPPLHDPRRRRRRQVAPHGGVPRARSTTLPVVRGRCLSYGEGITYWPVVEVVLQLEPAAVRPARGGGDRLAARGVGRAGDRGRDRLGVSEAARGVGAGRLRLRRSPLGRADLPRPRRSRRRLEPRRADPARLHRSAGAARPARDLGGRQAQRDTVLLEPLTPEETDELIERLLGDADLAEPLRARIGDAAEGNPLFVEQMLAMVAESPNGDVVVPPTIQALLAARLDQLDPSERGVLERGAVEGKIFHRGGVEALAPDEPDVPTKLMALVRKELVRPDRTQLPGDDAFRFRHLLIRDAAYDSLPKSARAELHERFAVWLESHGGDLIELDEILGYHLEQAHRYRVELGVEDEDTVSLARRAADRLATAGERALLRGDAPGACVLLERARALLPAEERPLELELLLVHARFDAGDLAEALVVADALATRMRTAGDRPGELRALLARGFVAHLAEATEVSEIRELVDEALAVFGELGDDAGLADAWLLASENELSLLRWRAMAVALERAIAHGKRGNHHVAVWAEAHRAPPYAYGPFPVEEGIAFFDAHPAAGSFQPAFRGQLEAMRGNFEAARQAMGLARERAREFGQRLAEAGHSMQEAEVELHAGDAARAAEVALEGVAALDALGERGWLSTVAGHGAEALYRLGRDEEAWQLTDKAEEAGAADDVITQMLILQVRAKLLARRGEHAEAERLARSAVEWVEPTDALEYKANALRDLAIVLSAAGKSDEAIAALKQAQPLYEEKGHTVGVARVEALRAELAPTPM